MSNKKLLDLLIEIRDSDIFSPTKDDYRNKGIREPMKLAHAYNLIEEYGKNGNNYRLTKNGYTVIDSQGDLSALNQSSSEDINVSSSTAQGVRTIKKIAIGLVITVIGGLLLWVIIEFIK